MMQSSIDSYQQDIRTSVFQQRSFQDGIKFQKLHLWFTKDPRMSNYNPDDPDSFDDTWAEYELEYSFSYLGPYENCWEHLGHPKEKHYHKYHEIVWVSQVCEEYKPEMNERFIYIGHLSCRYYTTVGYHDQFEYLQEMKMSGGDVTIWYQ